MNAMMPVLVEVPVNHEVRPMPESVRQRLEVQQKSAEEIALETQRKTARSEMLREAQLESITARAARETQRGEEAAARKRRNAAEEIRKLEAKMLEMTSKSEKRKQEQLEECEKRKQQKQAKAEAVVVSRAQTQMSQIKKGIEKATRACEAVAKRDKKVQEVVKKSSEHVKHVGRLAEQHLAAIKGTSSAGLMYSNPHVVYAVAGGAVIVLLVLIYCLCVRRSSKTSSSPSKRMKNSRNLMASFDVEGGSSTSHGNGNERVLHPSISTAAANADVATLRMWLATDRCVVDAALAVDGSTALHHAARAGHANIVRLLLDHGADSLVVDSELRTPLHHVAALGHG